MKLNFSLFVSALASPRVVNVEDHITRADQVLTGGFGTYLECPYGRVMRGTCTSGNDKESLKFKPWTQPRANWYSFRISLGEISSVVTLKLWKGLQIQWNKILSYRLVWRKPRTVFDFLIDPFIRQLRAFRKYWKELAQDFASYCYWKTGDFQEIINCGANELGKI